MLTRAVTEATEGDLRDDATVVVDRYGGPDLPRGAYRRRATPDRAPD